MANRPEPEVSLTVESVGALVRTQHPALGHLALQELSRGWDNTNFRLGDDHIVRVPHRHQAAPLIVHEQQWLPRLAERIELAIPAPTHLGEPAGSFPWHWSIVPWFEGTEAARADLADSAETAAVLGRFFAQLHQPAPSTAPPNPFRGVPIAERAEAFHSRLAMLPADREVAALAEVFAQAVATAPSSQHLWLHGDLHTRNMIVRDGQLAAAIDWGDICAGDPATDLAAAFMLVPNDIAVVAEHAGATEQDWERARGWAAHFAVIYLAHSDDDAVMGGIGQRLAEALLA